MGEDATGEGPERQASTTRALGVLDRIGRRFPRVGRVVVEPVRAIAMRYEGDELPTHAGALTYGAFLSLPPLLLLAASVIGFVIADPAKQEQVPHPVFRTLGVAVHHRGRRGDVEAVGRANHLDPLRRRQLVRAQRFAHLVVEDLRGRAGDAAEAGLLQHQQVLAQRHSRLFDAIPDFHR